MNGVFFLVVVEHFDCIECAAAASKNRSLFESIDRAASSVKLSLFESCLLLNNVDLMKKECIVMLIITTSKL